MKKLILSLIVFFSIASNQVNAQVEYMHSLGANYHLVYASYAGSSSLGGIPMVEYNPRLNIFGIGKDKVATFSVGSHIGLGFAISSNSFTGTTGYFGYNIPILAQLNFGKGSSKDNESGFGFYLEGGYTVLAINSSFAHGPTAGLGIRFSIVKPIEIGAFYTRPINVDYTHVFGVRVGYIFGIQ